MGNPKSKNLHHAFWYKWYDFDDLSWKIVELPENADRPLSFRAAGAWTAPMTEVEAGNQLLSELDRETVTRAVIPVFDESENLQREMMENLQTLDHNLDFLRIAQEQHLQRYPGSVRIDHVQQVLNAILKEDRQRALTLIEVRITAGDPGGFGFGDKTFFTAAKEWVLTH